MKVKVYLTNQVDLEWRCSLCEAEHKVTYSWPKPIIIDECELQNIVNHHHKESSPWCVGIPTYSVGKSDKPLVEHHLSLTQVIWLIAHTLGPLVMAAVLIYLMWLAAHAN